MNAHGDAKGMKVAEVDFSQRFAEYPSIQRIIFRIQHRAAALREFKSTGKEWKCDEEASRQPLKLATESTCVLYIKISSLEYNKITY